MSPPAPVDTASSSIDFSKPLTVDGVATWRAKSAKIPTTVAPAVDSDMYKSPVRRIAKKDKTGRRGSGLTHECRIVLRSQKRNDGIESTLKGAAKHLKNPGLISLGGGLPSAEYFPFEYIDIKVPTPPGFSPEATRESGAILRSTKNDIRNGTSLYDLEVALNYGQAMGAPQLLRFVTEHTEIIHNPPYSDWRCALNCGSTFAWDTVLRMLCERGDYILMEEYTFSSAVETVLPQGVKVASIQMDEHGLIPEAMDEILTNWDEAGRGARRPSVLYTIPTGQNPTGATQPADRRRAVYKVAQKHDILIVEDEPYYFLQMQPYTGSDAAATQPPASHDEFIKSLAPSFLSLDVDGRVIRLESFSKVIAPGTRVGWIVGAAQIIERFIRNCEVSSQNPSGISQVALIKLLEEHWGHLGYLEWLIHVRMQYTERRNILVRACEKSLPTEIAHWTPPAAGMFHWIGVDWQKHPDAVAGKTHAEIEEKIFLAAVNRGVLVSRGSWFTASKDSKEQKMFFRATFAAASGEKIVEAISRFGDTLREEFML